MEISSEESNETSEEWNDKSEEFSNASLKNEKYPARNLKFLGWRFEMPARWVPRRKDARAVRHH